MTKSEFKKNIYLLGNTIYFDLLSRKFNIGYIPVCLENGKWGYDEIGICEINNSIIELSDYEWYKTVDEMLEKYSIDGVSLGKLLDKIKNMHGIPTA